MLKENQGRKEQIERFINEGILYVIPERANEWISLCKSAKKDMDITLVKDTLETIKLLDEGKLSYEEIQRKVDVGQHSGLSWLILEGNVAKFYLEGYEFAKRESVLKGEKYYQSLEKIYEKNLSFPSQVNKFVSQIIEETKKCIIPQRAKEWEHVCRKRATSSMGVSLIKDIALTIRLLDEGKSPEDIRKEVDKGQHSGLSWSILESNVVKFSPRGYDFSIANSSLKSQEYKQQIEEIHKENLMLTNKKRR